MRTAPPDAGWVPLPDRRCQAAGGDAGNQQQQQGKTFHEHEATRQAAAASSSLSAMSKLAYTSCTSS